MTANKHIPWTESLAQWTESPFLGIESRINQIGFKCAVVTSFIYIRCVFGLFPLQSRLSWQWLEVSPRKTPPATLQAVILTAWKAVLPS